MSTRKRELAEVSAALRAQAERLRRLARKLPDLQKQPAEEVAAEIERQASILDGVALQEPRASR